MYYKLMTDKQLTVSRRWPVKCTTPVDEYLDCAKSDGSRCEREKQGSEIEGGARPARILVDRVDGCADDHLYRFGDRDHVAKTEPSAGPRRCGNARGARHVSASPRVFDRQSPLRPDFLPHQQSDPGDPDEQSDARRGRGQSCADDPNAGAAAGFQPRRNAGHAGRLRERQRHRDCWHKRRPSGRNVFPERWPIRGCRHLFGDQRNRVHGLFRPAVDRPSGDDPGHDGPGARLEKLRQHHLVSVLRRISIMQHPSKRQRAKGFTLLETMIAILVLAVGILGLAAMLGDSLAYMQGSEDDFIAQQKAEEAVEAIFTAKYTNSVTWAQVSNFSGGNPTGLFLPGALQLTVPGTDGLVGTAADTIAPPDYILGPGPDGKLGTADDVQIPLGSFTRTITITPYVGDANLRNINVTVNYKTGRFTRSYTINTLISAFD